MSSYSNRHAAVRYDHTVMNINRSKSGAALFALGTVARFKGGRLTSLARAYISSDPGISDNPREFTASARAQMHAHN